MLGPNTVPASGKNSVGINGILKRFVKTQQRVIVEGIGVHHRGLVRRRCAVFPPAMFCRDLNQPLESRAIFLIGFDIVRNRKTKEKDESPLPVARGQAEWRNGQAKLLGCLPKYSICLEYRFARPRNEEHTSELQS